MDKEREKEVINMARNSTSWFSGFLSKDKNDNWTVTIHWLRMGDGTCYTEQIEHTIANAQPSHVHYEIGQKVTGLLLEDGTYHLSSICDDTKNYDI